ncbi:MAG: hypothetical protein AAF997_08765 [Myxococcota bacterium]
MREFASLLLVAALVAWVVSPVSAERSIELSFVGTDVPAADLLEALSSSPSRQFKPIGRTSVLFRMRTVSRVTAGFKVESEGQEDGYRAEIAAYRLSRLLALDNVPPTIFRQANRREIQKKFHREKRDRWKGVAARTAWQPDGVVDGAASYWVKGARRGLDKRKGQWQAWLRVGGTIPEGKSSLAADLSSMTLFDFIVGNWDRYSGGNLLGSPDGTRALLVDHDSAFDRLNEPLYRRMLDDVMRTERFSMGFVRHLSALDRDAIERELSEDPSHAVTPLLNDAQIDALLDRRATVLSHVAALVEQHGSEQVLFFP